jgi:hypothetical protein
MKNENKTEKIQKNGPLKTEKNEGLDRVQSGDILFQQFN